jgi:hypothetical protein
MTWEARWLGAPFAAALLIFCSPSARAQDGAVIDYGPQTGIASPVYDGAPPPVYIPPPPQVEPNLEFGLRYWWSTGKTRFDINSSRLDPSFYGSPSSTLTYDNMHGNAGELFFRAENEKQLFFKGFVGGGGLDGGSLDDQDFFAGQVKFSDTYSKIEGDSLFYTTLDLGKRFTVATRGPQQFDIGPFVGVNYWQETADAYGARCNADDVGGEYCGQPGTMELPFGSKVITNEPRWVSLRVGTELRAKLFRRLTLIGDAAVLPVAYLSNEDSHYFRSDLGATPNIKDSGTGWGYQLQAAAQFDVTPNWAISGGVRYWYATTDGSADFVHVPDGDVALQNFTSERLGFFGDVTYKFWTF